MQNLSHPLNFSTFFHKKATILEGILLGLYMIDKTKLSHNYQVEENLFMVFNFVKLSFTEIKATRVLQVCL